jgi:hypothetical protein
MGPNTVLKLLGVAIIVGSIFYPPVPAPPRSMANDYVAQEAHYEQEDRKKWPLRILGAAILVIGIFTPSKWSRSDSDE